MGNIIKKDSENYFKEVEGMRKRSFRSIGIMILIVVLGIMVVQVQQNLGMSPIGGEFNENLHKYGIHTYKIEAQFLEEEKSLNVSQEVHYKNTHKEELDKIYFHLYSNAFKDKEKLPIGEEELNKAYPQGFEPGFIHIKDVKVEGEEAKFNLQGEQDTIMEIDLKKPIKKGEERKINFTYQVKIPPLVSRFGYGEKTYNLGNWYPIAAVYDHQGWHLDPYYEVGDPFYSEIGNYEVSIRLPEDFILASTGNIIKENKDKNKKEKEYQIKAEGVRDFAWVTSKEFKVLEDKVKGTTIKAYYLEGQNGDTALEVARESIKIFNSLFRTYPYKQFSVVACDFYIGGMEYPNIVYIDQNLFSKNTSFILEYVIAHEAAHQWWYGIVGNNQVKEPWVDEALTEYSTIMYFRERYGEESMEKILKTMVINDYKFHSKDSKEKISSPVDEFENNREYSKIVYSKGAMMFYELEKKVGVKNFREILKYYARENKFSQVTGKSIQKMTNVVTGEDYSEFFNKWLGSTK